MSISLEQHIAFKKMIDMHLIKKLEIKNQKLKFVLIYNMILLLVCLSIIEFVEPTELIMIPESLNSSCDSDSSRELFEFKYDPNIDDEYDIDIYDFESYIY